MSSVISISASEFAAATSSISETITTPLRPQHDHQIICGNIHHATISIPALPATRTIATQTSPGVLIRMNYSPKDTPVRPLPTRPSIAEIRRLSHDDSASVIFNRFDAADNIYERLCDEMPQLRPHLPAYLAHLGHMSTGHKRRLDRDSVTGHRYDSEGMRVFTDSESSAFPEIGSSEISLEF